MMSETKNDMTNPSESNEQHDTVVMCCYKINFGYGTAEMYTPKTDDPKKVFGELSNQCFGIRKSISMFELISTKERSIPDPWCKMEGAHQMLTHHSDVIVWDKDGKKIKSEFD